MVEKLRLLINKIKGEKGDISLCLLLREAAEFEKWTLIISAEWIDRIANNEAFSFWIQRLQSFLAKEELSMIVRITFLKEKDNFVSMITSSLNISGAAVELKNTSIGNFFINHAIIFEAHKRSVAKMANYQRNPAFNAQLNPILNPRINPILNPTINPILNPTINPILNPQINPILNPTINPILNPTINPILNPQINPILNPTINPALNPNINPALNPGFDGWIWYDRGVKALGYVIAANDTVRIFFNTSSETQGFGVKNAVGGFTLFDRSNSWIGQILPDGSDGYNYFTRSNKWVGFVK